ncbi:replication protein [Paenibacillus zanthoxyli]|uniref:replication protein n=1 Tax=Paenibacillus zanthoxyli TaxID=369399 RepID=UPI0018DBE7B0|nr:replication protein [Paenibacillus zanthoxyli]
MTDSRRKRGYVGIANQIWDEVIRRDFTKRQKDVLMFLWRLSYGCNQTVAVVPRQKDFALCGVGENKAGDELKHLAACKVIFRNGNEYRFNEDFEFWQISPVKGWDDERFKELIHLNIEVSKKCKSVDEPKPAPRLRLKKGKLPKTVTFSRKKTSQKGNFPSGDNFPKREDEFSAELPEKGRNIEENFPKREDGESSNPSGARDTAALNTSFKDSKDIYIAQFDEFWNLYPKKVGKKKAQEKFIKLAPDLDFEKVMTGTRNYISYCKRVNRYFKDGATFVNQQGWDDFAEGDGLVDQTAGQSKAPPLEKIKVTKEDQEFYDRLYGQSSGTT